MKRRLSPHLFGSWSARRFGEAHSPSLRLRPMLHSIDAERFRVTGADAKGMTIRRLGDDDVEAFRSVYLEALATQPDAFAMSYEEQRELPFEEMRQSFERLTVFGGFASGQLEGIATLQPQALLKRRHVAMISGMYVRDSLRGSGLAAAILQAVLDCAKLLVDQVELYVAVHNVRANKFYRRFGFEPYGVMRRSLRVDGVDHDAEMMVLIFR
jgi:RimJ/RimL family protein N-acetyltransferase